MANDRSTASGGGATAALPKGVKGYVENLALGGSDAAVMPFMFRPNEISEDISPRYNKTSALGMSFEYLPYEGTSNPSWSFEIYQHRVMILKEIGATGDVAAYFAAAEGARAKTVAGTTQQRDRNDNALLSQISAGMERSRRFLQALYYPPRIGESQAEAPPACLLVIPNLVSARCRAMEWRANYRACDRAGQLVEWAVSIRFEGAPLEQITMDDVLSRGLLIGRDRS